MRTFTTTGGGDPRPGPTGPDGDLEDAEMGTTVEVPDPVPEADDPQVVGAWDVDEPMEGQAPTG